MPEARGTRLLGESERPLTLAGACARAQSLAGLVRGAPNSRAPRGIVRAR
jgi:hypothetical protein